MTLNSTRLRELRELAERIRINQREKRRETMEKLAVRRAAAEIRRRRTRDAFQNGFHSDASSSSSEMSTSHDQPVDYDMPPSYDVPRINNNRPFRHALPTPHSIKWWNAYRDPNWDPETAHVIPQEQIRPVSPQPETPLKPDFDWKLTNNPDSILASTPLVTKHDIEEPQHEIEEPQYEIEEPQYDIEERQYDIEERQYNIEERQYDIEEPQTPEQPPVPEESQNLPLTPTLSPIDIAPPAEGKHPNADPPDEARDLLRALSRKLAKTSSPIIYDEDWDPVNRCPKKATKHGPSTDDKHGPSTDDVPNQPTNSGRAEEAREQEALQLRSMNSRLHAASRSIRDAYRNARQLVDSVDTAELMGHKCKACETCGHVEQHPIVMICTGIKRLLISSDNSHGRTNLTWFGLIFMVLSLWYMTEIAISEFFGTTDYASTMHGYGVFPDSPRYPFALLTLISWIPPFSWLTPLFKANMFYEATKTVQGF